MARRCIFCGGTKLTKEHVLPDWLAEVVPKPDSATRTVGVAPQAKSNPGRLFTDTVRCVCSTCNSGWMSDLEVAAMPLITPLLRGEITALGEDAQRTLALWAVKTAIIACHLRPSIPVVRDHAESLRSNLEPPANCFVWIAHQQEHHLASFRRYPLAFHLNREPLPGVEGSPSFPINPLDINGYAVTVGVEQFAFQVFSIEDTRVELSPAHGDLIRPSVADIWPTVKGCVFPAGPAFTTKGMNAFAESWINSQPYLIK